MKGWIGLAATAVAAGVIAAVGGRPYVGAVVVVAVAVTALVVVVSTRPRAQRFRPAVVPVAIAAIVAVAGRSDRIYAWSVDHGDPGLVHRAMILAAFGALVAVLIAAGVDVAGAIGRGARGLGHALFVIGSGALFLIAVIPVWCWSRLRGRDRFRRRDARSWHRVDAHDASSRLVAAAGGRRSLLGRLSWALGCLLLVVAADFGLGWAWDTATAKEPTAPDAVVTQGDAAPLPPDPRADLPAMAAYPWRNQYFDDIRRTPSTYWPFTEYRPGDFHSKYVNIDGWARRSYEPDGDADDMPTIWMFGGSTTWGEGQRDAYTIPSWIARLAERAGTPVRVVNYGQRGFTHYQDMILFDQLLAQHPAPDLATFYDGANEINAQAMVTEPVPSHPLAFDYAQKLYGTTIATEAEPQADGTSWDDIWQTYRRHSLLNHLVGDVTGQPAGAAPAQADDDVPTEIDGFTKGGQLDPAHGGTTYTTTEQDGIDAGRVYARGQLLTRAIAAAHDVPALFFWQPIGYDNAPEQRARESLPDGTIDIHTVLQDHPEVFIDGGHTNEEGARIAAEAMWKRLAPQVTDWYESR